VRVIAGLVKGRQLKTPKGSNTRPLTDRVRGALFNILSAKAVESEFLDLFAGTGAVGIEALSRGASRAVFVELNRKAVELIRENLALTGFSERAEVFLADALRAIGLLSGKGERFDLIFIGAPYDSPILAKVIEKIAESELLKPDGILIAEHRKQHQLDPFYGKIKLYREAKYGETVLNFYTT